MTVLDIDTIQQLRAQGLKYKEIAAKYGVSKGKVIGAVWRHENPDRYKHHLNHMNDRQILIVVPQDIKKELKAMAEKENKTMSKFCFELLIDGYKHRKAEK